VFVVAIGVVVIILGVEEELCHVLIIFTEIRFLLLSSSYGHEKVDLLHGVDDLLLQIEVVSYLELEIACVEKLVICVRVLYLHV